MSSKGWVSRSTKVWHGRLGFEEGRAWGHTHGSPSLTCVLFCEACHVLRSEMLRTSREWCRSP